MVSSQHAYFSSLSGRARVEYRLPDSTEFSSGAAIAFRAPFSLRVDLLSPFGTTIGTWISTSDTLIIYDWNDRKYILTTSPSRAAGDQYAGIIGMVEKISAALSGVYLSTEKDLSGDLSEVSDGTGFTLKNELGEYRYLFDLHGRLIQIAVRTESDGCLDFYFSGHTEWDGFSHPDEISVETCGAREFFRIEFSRKTLNAPIADEAFIFQPG